MKSGLLLILRRFGLSELSGLVLVQNLDHIYGCITILQAISKQAYRGAKQR